MKRTLSLLLVALLAAGAVGCNEAKDDPAATTAGNQETQPVESAEPTPQLPEKDYEGYAFKIYDAETIVSDGIDGEVLNDAIYEANERVRNDFNITFEKIPGGGTDPTKITASIQAQDDDFDLIFFHDCTTASLSLEGLLLNINDLPYVDTTMPWWPQHNINSLTLNGRMYYYSNYTSYNGMYGTQATFFNKKLIKDYNLEDPYAITRDGSWTLDKLAELSKQIYADTNGSSKADDGDTFGFMVTNFPYRWLESFGIEAYKKVGTDTFELELDVNNERTIALVEKLHNWLYSGNEGIVGNFMELSTREWNTFTNGNAAFVFAPVGVLAPMLMDSDVDFGIVPMPKMDSNQETYMSGQNATLFSVPITASDTERTGTIIEAMSYAAYKEVLPAYIEKTLQGRYATDIDTVEMLDLVFENQVMSFAYLFANNVPDGMQFRLIFDTVPNNNFASWYKKSEKKELKMLDNLMEFYTKNAE